MKSSKNSLRSFFQEFKAFIKRGSVIDMAVGIIVGASFTKIVNSLVNEIIMPPLGWILGGINLTEFQWVLKSKTETHVGVVLQYGKFLNALLDFFLVSIAVFILIKIINTLYHKKDSSPNFKTCKYCYMQVPIEAVRCGHCTSHFQKETSK